MFASLLATADASAPNLGGIPEASEPGVLLPALALAILAAAAWFFARRRARTGRTLQVLESTSLGPKRSVVLVKVGEEVLVLGSSEAGISLLATRPADALAPAPDGARSDGEPGFAEALAAAARSRP